MIEKGKRKKTVDKKDSWKNKGKKGRKELDKEMEEERTNQTKGK